MKLTFINGLLLFIIVNLILVYVYQTLEDNCENNNNGICKYLPRIPKHNNTSDTISKNNFNTVNNNTNPNSNTLQFKNNKLRLLTNDKGPKIGFHQTFKPHLPELGWRDFYLRLNSGINNVELLNPQTMDDGKTLTNDTSLPFSNIITNNYLSQLESTDNIYKHVDY